MRRLAYLIGGFTADVAFIVACGEEAATIAAQAAGRAKEILLDENGIGAENVQEAIEKLTSFFKDADDRASKAESEIASIKANQENYGREISALKKVGVKGDAGPVGPTGPAGTGVPFYVYDKMNTKLGRLVDSDGSYGEILVWNEDSSILVAMDWLHKNPVKLLPRAPKPQDEEHEVKAMTPEQARAFLDALPARHRPFFQTLVFTGLRLSEGLALKWDDVDLDAKKIHVRRSLYKGQYTTPKSKTSKRKVDIGPTLMAVLPQLPSRFKGDLVFPDETGKPMDASNLRNRVFYEALETASRSLAEVATTEKQRDAAKSVLDSRIHDLRHTYAALQIAAGAHPKYLQQQMGHYSIQVTLDIYGHLLPDAFASNAEKIEAHVFVLSKSDDHRMDRQSAQDAVTPGELSGSPGSFSPDFLLASIGPMNPSQV